MTRRGLVLGGSVAGLLAAAALSETYDEVVIVERDDLPDSPEFRRGVPQGMQVHALLPVGQDAMESLLPGLSDDIEKAGGVVVDSPAEIAIFGAQGWSGRVQSSVRVACARRPLIEWAIRERVLTLPNVSLVPGRAEGLIADDAGDTVTGVRLEGREAALEAEFVVDATGRISKAPSWLEELGYASPEEKQLKSFIGYATVPVRVPQGVLPAGVRGLLSHPHPGNPVGGAIFPCDNGIHLLSGLGMVRNDPPAENMALLDYLDGASTPVLGRIARQVEFLDKVKLYRIPGSRRRLFEDLSRRPEGFVVMGDALMAFNPLYGQGMSVAACEAVALRDGMRDRQEVESGLARHLQKEFAAVLKPVYDLLVSTDGRYDDAELIGIDRPDLASAEWSRALSQLATEDAEAALALKQFSNYFDPSALASPSIQKKVDAWIDEGRSAVNNDPEVVPGLV